MAWGGGTGEDVRRHPMTHTLAACVAFMARRMGDAEMLEWAQGMLPSPAAWSMDRERIRDALFHVRDRAQVVERERWRV